MRASTKRALSSDGLLSASTEPTSVTADRLNAIATAAYYKAEARGFAPGQELDDWLGAEANFDEIRKR